MSVARIDDTPLRPYHSPKSMAQYLNVSERTVRAWIADRKIRSVRVGGQHRIAAEDLDVFLAKHTTEANND